MSYTALYRKFRPARFEDVKGQEHIVTTLRNQIKSDKIQHAYLFCGTRGTGKTSVAKLFAKAINCEHPTDGNPCLECPTCKAIASQSALNVVEIDAASNNGVDNIRQIIEEIAYPPTDGRFKVYIIDEVHMLSIGAFNALLKTLEEPPSYVVFILATTEVHKLPVTILSRCQRYDFKRISVNDIVERINELLPEEGIEADDDAIRYIAKNADGALRDALSLLDQCIAFNFGQRLTYDMVLETLGAVDLKVFSVMLRSIISGRVSDAIASLNAVIMEGRDLSQFVSDFTWYLRNLLLAVTSDDISSVVDMSKENLDNLLVEASQIDEETAMRYIRILSELSNQIRYASNKRILTELAVIKMCRPESERKDDSLISRIRAIENKLESSEYSISSARIPASEAAAENAEDEPAPVLNIAVPEDIKRVVINWNEIIKRSPYPQKMYIAHAVPSLSDAGELIIAFEKNTDMVFFTSGDDYEQHFKALQDLINGYAGAEIRLRLAVNKQPGDVNGVSYPDLTKMDFFKEKGIKVEVVEDDEE